MKILLRSGGLLLHSIFLIISKLWYKFIEPNANYDHFINNDSIDYNFF